MKIHSLMDKKNIDSKYNAYRVFYNNKSYIVRYSDKELQEVYFLEKPNRWMSCRIDMKTISYYDVYKDYILRIENGVVNRKYHITNKNYLYYEENGVKVIYEAGLYEHVVSDDQIEHDLKQFLIKFNKFGLDNLLMQI